MSEALIKFNMAAFKASVDKFYPRHNQREAWNTIVNTTDNIICYGAGGTGKTYMAICIVHYYNYWLDSDIRVVLFDTDSNIPPYIGETTISPTDINMIVINLNMSEDGHIIRSMSKRVAEWVGEKDKAFGGKRVILFQSNIKPLNQDDMLNINKPKIIYI